MDILEKVLAQKHKEVADNKGLYPVKLLEKSIFFPSDTISLTDYLLRADMLGIIAEIKRKSPSKGLINEFVSVEQTSISYMQGGASALSILTDQQFFGGSNDDLRTAREFNFCPILRKDFIIDEYQVLEAKSIGADAILLIAAALSPKKLLELARFAKSLGLQVLMEVHNKQELEMHLNDHLDLVGVNNRNLKTFEVDVQTSMALSELIPAEFVKISESGISNPNTVLHLMEYGFQGFLIGEYFMSHSRPGAACAEFIKKTKQLKATIRP
jgi:indole-3-glycerol phosphate synthase